MIGAFQLSCRTPLVWFGAGRALDLPRRVDQLGAQRVLVACTPSGKRRYARVLEALGARLAGVFAQAQPHCPIDVAQAALDRFRLERCDCVVSIGGGSSIGLGKFIAVETGAPHIALPTTLSGSEMTPLFGVLVDGEKRSRREPRALADTVIADASLAVTLPLRETASTGMNAMAHCIEAFYMADRNPVTDAIAQQGVDALYGALKRLATTPADLEAREQAAFGALLGGFLVASVGIGLHHRICHVLGGRFGAPHGETNGAVLPHVLAFNAPAIPAALGRLEPVFGPRPAHALQALARSLGTPIALRDLDVHRAALPEVAREVLRHAGPNPRPVSESVLIELLEQAWVGSTPLETSHVG